MAHLYDDPGNEPFLVYHQITYITDASDLHTEYPTRMIDPEEMKELHPLIDISGIQAGVYTPNDGDIDPTTLTNALARIAKVCRFG